MIKPFFMEYLWKLKLHLFLEEGERVTESNMQVHCVNRFLPETG